MISLAEARAVFVAAAGLRRSLPRLLQYLLFARAHRMRPLVAVASQQEALLALALGADVLHDTTSLGIERLRPDVVVVDDAIAAQTGGWILAAQRVGALVLDVGDLGLQDVDAEAIPRAAAAAAPRSAAPKRHGQAQPGDRG
jgi:hypothetical protein